MIYYMLCPAKLINRLRAWPDWGALIPLVMLLGSCFLFALPAFVISIWIGLLVWFVLIVIMIGILFGSFWLVNWMENKH